MAVLAVTNPTLLDLAKATDPDGRIAPVVEILHDGRGSAVNSPYPRPRVVI